MYFPFDYSPVKDGVADAVFAQLLDDYDAEAIEWVLAAQWCGPEYVDTRNIDFTNSNNWVASSEPEKVDEFADMIKNGIKKPIILVQMPDRTAFYPGTPAAPLMVLDGHHRLLAYQKLEQPALAYIARVGSCYGPWVDMHSSQRVGPSIRT